MKVVNGIQLAYVRKIFCQTFDIVPTLTNIQTILLKKLQISIMTLSKER